MVRKCDFLALTFLLKNAANVNQHYSQEERLLILYFRWQFLSLAVRLLLRFGEKQAVLSHRGVYGNFVTFTIASS